MGQVVSGGRLTPTTHRCGIFTYLLRDAQRGLLEHSPVDLLFRQAPASPNTWELSRCFVAKGKRRSTVKRELKRLFVELPMIAAELKAERIVTIQSTEWTYQARRNGLSVVALGKPMVLRGKRFQAVEINITAA